MLPYYKFAEPNPHQLSLGIGSPCSLDKCNFRIRDSTNDEHGSGGIVFGAGGFGLIHSEEVAHVSHDAALLVGGSFDMFGEVEWVGFRPWRARDVNAKGGFDVVQIVAEGGERDGAEEGGEVGEFLEKEGGGATAACAGESLLVVAG